MNNTLMVPGAYRSGTVGVSDPLRKVSTLSQRAMMEGLEVLEKYKHSVAPAQAKLSIAISNGRAPSTASAHSHFTISAGSSSHGSRTVREKSESPRSRTSSVFSTTSVDGPCCDPKQMCDQFGLKYVGVLVLFIGYMFLGGVLFQKLEHEHELNRLNATRQLNNQRRDLFASNLTRFIITTFNANKNTENSGNSVCDSDCVAQTVNTMLTDYDQNTGLMKSEQLPLYNWGNLFAAVYYSATLITTIGYGNLACRTQIGRVMTVVYSMIGLPITLMVLDRWGRLLFTWAQEAYYDSHWRFRRMVRYIRRAIRRHKQPLRHLRRMRSSRRDTLPAINRIEDTLPLSLALAVVAVYTCFCAAVFTIWEPKWNYFDSMYFLFISLSTIGLGDQIPHHPTFAISSFLLFVIGLAFVSMCVNVLRARLEARYLAAIHMVEQQASLASRRLSEGFSAAPAREPSTTGSLQPSANNHLEFRRSCDYQIDSRSLPAILIDEFQSNPRSRTPSDPDPPLPTAPSSLAAVSLEQDSDTNTAVVRKTGDPDLQTEFNCNSNAAQVSKSMSTQSQRLMFVPTFIFGAPGQVEEEDESANDVWF